MCELSLENWGADAAVGSLNVEHGTNGGGDVGHVGQAARLARGDVPTHENQGDVGVALAPCTVGGSFIFNFSKLNASTMNNVAVAAASREIAQFDAFLEN